MTEIRSKNLYELLGNDPELDPNRPAPPPAKAVDRPAARSGKRDAPNEAPTAAPREGNNNRRGGRVTAGNEAAFRDRNAGRSNNRSKPTDEAEQPARGGRGGRGRGDRQSRTGQTDTRKQVQQGWGAESGEKTLDDERQGEKLAKAEENAPETPAEEIEEPDNSKSFSEYLAEKAARESLAAKPVRAANEGVKEDKKWATAKEVEHKEEEAYFQGSGEKTQRQKQRKEKNFLDVDLRFVEQPRSTPAPRGGRGGRGGDRAPRGDRPPRGAPRGGAPRGSGAPRGAPAAGAPRGASAAGAPRGGRGAPRGPTGPTVDEKNFPSLGGN
ncbi:uncharacterized protein N7443_010423 [Penicillium atrosanguineum]|uniref:Hyaluronan/mRNA-binding protein domain-containing protein n=1 Tax=Penicillium atrosanguineum TaxID=1132637 RepID=A0A9W9PTE5_9EURO|nr:uncharacterized protein N7443_010423 [Penicillium atrosanguineum]KAJ5290170.1 hypothetical protein N7443_010423 [Penicillium atrosanguineum]KAJ5307994.1 hypothetical protein N7476_008650 [Penicillium atrosanguineum]